MLISRTQTIVLSLFAFCLLLKAQEKTAVSTSAKIESEIKRAVYADFIAGHLKDGAARTYYGAFFFSAKSNEVSFLQAYFTNNAPRFEFATNNIVVKKGCISDRITGKPATLFWAKIGAITNNIADVRAGYHSDPEAGATFDYKVKCVGTNTTVVSKEMRVIW